MNPETREVLESVADVMHAFAAKLLIVQAHLDALEIAFLSAEKKRGRSPEEVQGMIRDLRQEFAQNGLTGISDRGPPTVEAMDVK